MGIEILQKEDIALLLSEIKELKQMVIELKKNQSNNPSNYSINTVKYTLSLNKAAEIAGCNVKTIRKAIADGLIKAEPLTTGGHPKITKGELDRYLNSRGTVTGIIVPPNPNHKMPNRVKRIHQLATNN